MPPKKFFAYARVIPAALLVLITALYFSYMNRPVNKEAFLFGTLIRITAYGRGARPAVERSLAVMEMVEKRVETGMAGINSRAGEEPVKVGEELFFLLQEIFKQAGRTGGYFNPVIGPLVEVWEFGPGGAGRFPSPEEIAAVFPLLAPEEVVFNEDEKTVYLSRVGMRLDLGGAVKGYAVDRAWEILKSAGVRGALINAGESSIRVWGERPGGGAWRVAVAHPREKEWIGILALPSGKAVGTSADTQRYITIEGRRYSHLFNPLTGYPPADLFSATVIADSALEADFFSTAVFVAENRDRLELLDRWMVEGVVVDSSGVAESPGMKKLWYGGSH